MRKMSLRSEVRDTRRLIIAVVVQNSSCGMYSPMLACQGLVLALGKPNLLHAIILLSLNDMTILV